MTEIKTTGWGTGRWRQLLGIALIWATMCWLAVIAAAVSQRGQGRVSEQAWDYRAAMKQVAERFAGREGVVLHIGDSITYANPYSQWARGGKGKTKHDQEVLAWMHTGQKDDTDGWFLASDDAGRGRSHTAASGIKADQLRKGGFRKLPSFARLLSQYKPQMIVLMIGTNDVSSGRSVNNFTKDLEAMIDEALQQGTICILSTIPPHPRKTELGQQYNDAIRKIGRQRSLPLIDFEQEILKRQPDRWNGTLLGKNDVHPSSKIELPGGRKIGSKDKPTEANLRQVGYLLRGWLSVQKIAEVKANVLDR